MYKQEVLYFTKAIKLARDNFYIDAIEKFTQLVDKFPDSDLADDAEYNIAFCYYEMNQFEKAIFWLSDLIQNYPESTITTLENSNDFGKTSAKAYFLMVNCYLALNQIEKAQEIVPEVEKYTDSYIKKDDDKITYHQLAKKAIKVYISMTRKRKGEST